MPTNPADSRAGAMEVRNLGMLAVACALFETVWRDAKPLGTVSIVDDNGLSPTEREVLKLLSEGHTDESLGRRLGVSVRTVRRTIADLTERLGATSRFEARRQRRPPRLGLIGCRTRVPVLTIRLTYWCARVDTGLTSTKRRPLGGPIPSPHVDNLSRRTLLRLGLGVAATTGVAGLTGCGGALSSGSNRTGGSGRNVKIGFIALTDCASLVMAKELGYFADLGLDVELIKQASWPVTRDNLLNGSIDAAHCLFSMPMSVATKIGGTGVSDLKIAMMLNNNGQAITLKKEFASRGIRGSCRGQGAARAEGPGPGHDVPGRHARHVAPVLAQGDQGRSIHSGHQADPAAADGREHEGRHHGRILRRRTVERGGGRRGDRIHAPGDPGPVAAPSRKRRS
jgi:DNA-binding CsgD family transcriptional regulator